VLLLLTVVASVSVVAVGGRMVAAAGAVGEGLGKRSGALATSSWTSCTTVENRSGTSSMWLRWYDHG
jgi:hypothetical protein